MNRRSLLTALIALVPATSAVAFFHRSGAETLSAQEAFNGANEGTLTLIDIRTPGEWARTGVGTGAIPIDMRAPDFLDQLMQNVDGNPNAPIALICATGGRSSRLAKALTTAGFTNILDVSEGMMGSRAGPGWISQGLPVTKN